MPDTQITPEQQALNVANAQIIITGLKKGDSKMAILTALIRNDSTLDLGNAGALYKQVGTENQLILNKEQKENLVVEIAVQHIADKKLDREKAIAALMERGAMTKNSATNYLKGYCAANEIEFPTVARTKRDMTAVHTAYKAWMEQKTSRESIQAGLVQHFGYTEASVSQAYLKIGKELGFITADASQGRTELATWFATPENVVGDKKTIVAKLMADTKIAKATAESRYANYLFAVEYCRVREELNSAGDTTTAE